MKFTVITGPGRCGSSALTQFFLNSKMFRVDQGGGFNPKMRAGYESYDAILANSLIHSSKDITTTLSLGLDRICHLYGIADIIKTPTFFYLDVYKEWKHCLRGTEGMQVILLKRDFNEVFDSVKRISSNDWDNIDEDKLSYLWDKNINTLDKLEIPYIIMDYPKFSKDPKYLYNNLKKLDLGSWDYNLQEISDLSLTTFYK